MRMPRCWSWPVSVAVDTALSLAFNSSVSVIGSDAGTAPSSLTRCLAARPTFRDRRTTAPAAAAASSPIVRRARSREPAGGTGGRMGSILGNRVLRVEDPRMLTVGGTYVEDVELAGAAVAHLRPVAHRPRRDRHDRHRRGASRCPASSPSSPAPTWRPGSAAPATSTRCSTRRCAGRSWPPNASATSASPSSRSSSETARRRHRRRRARASSTTTRCRSWSTPRSSRRDEVLLFPDAGTNVVHRWRRRRPADFGDCEVVVEARIVNQRLTAAPIEARSGAAYWTDDGRLVHYSACQGAAPDPRLAGRGVRPRARRRCG